ncbi:collagen alpha-2(VIII) chain-like [Pecten maximus]|uniref:collagen alpha-2(VIII) chain-like n=1 Tax=Pecten maximus TaxID=6579 RepID=UPI001458EB05|nr:collagen alpha-2(VIII) chain-like [Pecten maximus]
MDSENPKLGSSPRVGAPTDNIVAFTAYLSHTILEPGSDYSIKYDHVVTNAGNGYSPVTGAFTCPEDGVYVITWTTAMANQGCIQTHLKKNGVSVGYSFIAYQSNYPDMGSQTSVLVLSRGDVLTVKIESKTSGPALYATYTSFSGFLLK